MFKALIKTFQKKRTGIPILFVFAALGIWAGYQVGWTEFNEQSLWDWMELLIIPIVLGAGALLFQRAGRIAERKSALDEERVERELLIDRQRQETLMTYFDRMESLLLQHGLRESREGSEVRTVARARTLSVLRNLD